MVAEVIPSVFVDGEFIPFDDQWAYLSSVKKLSEKDVQTFCVEIRKTVSDFLANDFDNNKNDEASDVVQIGTAYKIFGTSATNSNTQSDNLNCQSHILPTQSVQLTQNDFSSAVRITFSNQQPRRRASGYVVLIRWLQSAFIPFITARSARV